MSDESDTTPRLGTASGIAYTEANNAPFIYFDGVACHGTLNGVVEIELVARIMAPTTDGGVRITFGPVGRLRCSLAGAAALLDSLQKATATTASSEQQPPEASKLN